MATVHVSNISNQTTEKEVRDFFSFCGKITSLTVTPESGESGASKSATVSFEKETAAKTALLLDQTQLGGAPVQVTSAANLDELASGKSAPAEEAKDENGQEIEQEDKPRSRIFAEYLAQGYVIGDNAIQKAIALDQKHGFSKRFTDTLKNWDGKYHATDKAKGLDESYQISNKAASGWRGLHSYFEKALDTPTGRKVREFYMQSDKQVRDIHNEARRLADLKSGKGEETEGQETSATSGAPSDPTGTAPAQPAV